MIYKSLLIGVLACVLSVFAGYHYGYKKGSEAVQVLWDNEKKEQAEKALQTVNLDLEKSFKLGLKYEEDKKYVQEVTKTIIREIPIYIKDTSTCAKFPTGWGVLHDLGTKH